LSGVSQLPGRQWHVLRFGGLGTRNRETGKWENDELRRTLSLFMFKWASHLVVMVSSFIASLLWHLPARNFHRPPPKVTLLRQPAAFVSKQMWLSYLPVFREKVYNPWTSVVFQGTSSLPLETNHCGGWKKHRGTHTKAAVSRHNAGNPPSKSSGVDSGVLSRYAVPIGSGVSLEFPSEYPGWSSVTVAGVSILASSRVDVLSIFSQIIYQFL